MLLSQAGRWLLPLMVLLTFFGCDHAPKPKRTASKPRVKTREILHKTTQDVRPAAPEIKQGAQVVPAKVEVKDPITMPGHVYVMAVNKFIAAQVHEAIELFRAERGEYPRNDQEFMAEVIKQGRPDGIQLPVLPYDQDYGYDEVNHKLIILRYPDRKAAYQAQQQQAGQPGGP